MNPLTLYRASGHGVTLFDILALAPGAVGYLLAPQSFAIARVRPGNASLEWDGFDLEPDQVYEARLATGTLELRWLRNPACPAGTGRAALLSEAPLPDLPPGWRREDDLPEVTCHDTPLLLGVRIAGPQQEWIAVDAPRHGRLGLPWDGAPPAQGRIAWRWREYIGPAAGAAGQDGNRTVVAARLAGWMILEQEAA